MSTEREILGKRHGNFALASMAALLAMSVSHQAMAACSPDSASVGNGQNVLCSGDPITAGYIVPTGITGVAITFDSTANITGYQQVGFGTNHAFASVQINDGSSITIESGGKITNTSNQVRDNYAVSLAGSNTTLSNSGTISASGTGSTRIYGVIATTSDPDGLDNVSITNKGDISASATLAGRAFGVFSGEKIEDMTVDNYKNISASGGTGTVAGIGSDDDTDSLTVNNHEGGTIKGTGTNAYAVGGNAASIQINNDGTLIGNYTGSPVFSPAVPINTALAAIVITGGSDDEAGSATIDNSAKGKILGDVRITDFSTSGVGAAPATVGSNPARPVATIDTRDSYFTNEGIVAGSFLYGAGDHTLINTGTITGVSNKLSDGIFVNQSYLNGGMATLAPGVGAASFTLINQGNLGGNITIHDRTDSENSITLSGDGFTGDIATDNQGSNSLALDNVTQIGAVTNVTSLDLMQSHVTTTGGITLSSNDAVDDTSTIKTTIFGHGQGDLGSVTGGTLHLNGDATNITPTFATIVRTGDVYQLASDVQGSTIDQITVDKTFLVTTTPSFNGSSLLLTTSVADAFTAPGISKPAGTTLNSLLGYTGSDPNVLALGGGVENLKNGSDVAKAGAQLAPETNFATQQSAITLNNAIGQHIDTRLNSVGATGAFQGYTPGPYGLGMKQQKSDPNRSNLGASLKDDDQDFVAPRSTAIWAQGFGAGMNQDQREQVDGYDARLYGFLAGYDNWISPGLRVGIAGGYANTTIDGDGDTTQNHTDIDSYLVEAYGAFKGSGWYATGRAGFTWHNYDTTRALTVPFSDTAKGSHDGDQFNVAIEVGAPWRYAGTVITPVASLTYSHLHQGGYSESSAGGMALSVAGQDNDSLVSGAGLKGLVPIAPDTVIEGRALWLHEFADDSQIVTASFAAGGGTFTAAGPGVGRDSADLGLGMLANIGSNSTFEINYDANVREDYLAHIGSARVDINF